MGDYVDLTDTLSADCYYKTDTHWRQDKLLPAAGHEPMVVEL